MSGVVLLEHVLPGLPALTPAREVTVEGGAVTVRRETDDGVTVLSAALPAVVPVDEKIAEPRHPSFTGIVAAETTFALLAAQVLLAAVRRRDAAVATAEPPVAGDGEVGSATRTPSPGSTPPGPASP